MAKTGRKSKNKAGPAILRAPDDAPQWVKDALWVAGRGPGWIVRERQGRLWVRQDGQRGGGSLTIPEPQELNDFDRLLNKTWRRHRLIAHRRKGSDAVKAMAELRARAIRDFARSQGWPRRGTTKLTVLHFDPKHGEAPKELRCGRSTVLGVLTQLRVAATK